MTLLSNAFVATPSTSDTITNVNDKQAASTPGPTSSTTINDGSNPSPSQVLAMTIRKKRKVLRRKDRDLRVELLLTSTIRRLCQEIGDHLRSRRSVNGKRKIDDETTPSTPTVRQHVPKKSRFFAKNGDDELFKKEEVGPVEICAQMPEPSSNNSVGPLVLDDQKIEDHSASGQQLRKRKADDEIESEIGRKAIPDSNSGASEDSFNEKDPFGLDEFFRSLRTCRAGGSKR